MLQCRHVFSDQKPSRKKRYILVPHVEQGAEERISIHSGHSLKMRAFWSNKEWQGKCKSKPNLLKTLFSIGLERQNHNKIKSWLLVVCRVFSKVFNFKTITNKNLKSNFISQSLHKQKLHQPIRRGKRKQTWGKLNEQATCIFAY